MDVVVVGAGLAGLVAARRLRTAGHAVTVLDKGRVVGGRTASRGIDGARHDQGAQFVTLRDERVADLTGELRAAGALLPWFRGAPDVHADQLPWATTGGRDGAGDGADGDGDGHQRYRGGPSARGPAEHLAAGLAADGVELRTGWRAAALAVEGGRWRVTGDDHGAVTTGDALVCTAPPPQTTALLDAGGTTPDAGLAAALGAVRHEPCWTVLATPVDEPALPPHGAARLAGHDVLAFVCDERRKGTSAGPAVTLHSTGAWAQAHLEDDRAAVGAALVAAAEPLLGTRLAVRHVHRWRYATPVAHGEDPAPLGTATGRDGSGAPLALAGDGFVGGRVEGAMVSGHLAGTRLATLR